VDVSGFARQTGAAYGVSLLNNGKYSYDVNIRDIGLTVLRSPVFAHHIPAAVDPQGHYAFIDQGQQRFRYLLLPHAGSWEEAGTVRRAAELNQPAVVLAASCHPGPWPPQGSFFEAGPGNIALSALKLAEDGQGWVVRACETARRAAQGWIEARFLNRRVEARFGPAEVKTFYLPFDPAQPAREVNFLEE
jgi:alpha-mannosidase